MDLPTLRAAMQPTSVTDATLTAYLPHYNEAMRAADITTVNRAAAFASQVGHESAGLRYMAEIQTSDPSWSWDRTRYRGRGPIQLTWESNYRKFGQWCAQRGYTTDSELFVNQPELVEQPRWGFLAASWYWVNGGPRPGQINGYADAGDILAVSRCINGWIEGRMPNGWDDRTNRWNHCRAMGDTILPTKPGENMPENMPGRPDFNEYAIWSPNHYATRQGNNPYCFLLHTQEPPDNAADALTNDNAADDLARNVLANPANQVSYHYSISQARDGGVTVVDCVDTDQPSWSVGDANNISINLCFAGSRARWTRDQWLKQAKAIDVAAYLAVQDCVKYGMSTLVVPPPYTAGKPGISDHNWVTKVFGWGSHTDVGPNYPWDYFAERVAYWWAALTGGVTPPSPVPTAPPANPKPTDPAFEVMAQMRGRWERFGWQTFIEAFAEVRDHVLGTNDKDKTGFRW